MIVFSLSLPLSFSFFLPYLYLSLLSHKHIIWIFWLNSYSVYQNPCSVVNWCNKDKRRAVQFAVPLSLIWYYINETVISSSIQPLFQSCSCLLSGLGPNMNQTWMPEWQPWPRPMNGRLGPGHGQSRAPHPLAAGQSKFASTNLLVWIVINFLGGGGRHFLLSIFNTSILIPFMYLINFPL